MTLPSRRKHRTTVQTTGQKSRRSFGIYDRDQRSRTGHQQPAKSSRRRPFSAWSLFLFSGLSLLANGARAQQYNPPVHVPPGGQYQANIRQQANVRYSGIVAPESNDPSLIGTAPAPQVNQPHYPQPRSPQLQARLSRALGIGRRNRSQHNHAYAQVPTPVRESAVQPVAYQQANSVMLFPASDREPVVQPTGYQLANPVVQQPAAIQTGAIAMEQPLTDSPADHKSQQVPERFVRLENRHVDLSTGMRMSGSTQHDDRAIRKAKQRGVDSENQVGGYVSTPRIPDPVIQGQDSQSQPSQPYVDEPYYESEYNSGSRRDATMAPENGLRDNEVLYADEVVMAEEELELLPGEYVAMTEEERLAQERSVLKQRRGTPATQIGSPRVIDNDLRIEPFIQEDDEELEREEIGGEEESPDDLERQNSLEISCDEMRSELLNNPITDIALDISPPRAKIVKNSAEYRVWNDVFGRQTGTGAINAIRRGYLLLDANGQKVAVGNLGDSELQAMADHWLLPRECTVSQDSFYGRAFVPQTVTWKASNLCHKPLYFENIQLERYGHSHGPFSQPIHSTLHFFGKLAFLPYQTGINPPNECHYALGYYRPGNCAPWLRDPFPISLAGASHQTAAVVGGAFLYAP